MKKITFITLLIFFTIFGKSFAIEVTSLEAEKRLEFSELFPKIFVIKFMKTVHLEKKINYLKSWN